MNRSALKRSGFRRRAPFVRKPSERPKRNYESQYSTLKRGTKLRMVGNNSKSKDWRRAWPKLKKKLERAGVTRCEECSGDYFLTPAHSLKRRHITNETELNEVALLCRECHRKCDEEMSHEDMARHIRDIITRRDHETCLRVA